MKVLYYTPGWPVSDFSNGIVSYLNFLLPSLRQRGVDPLLVAGEIGASHEGDARAIRRSNRSVDQVIELARRLAYRLSPSLASDLSFRAHLYLAGRDLRRKGTIDLVEMEESFGVAAALAAGASAPLIVRLHGPAFLTRPPNQDSTDPSLADLVRREGQLIARADGISSPARDVLDRVRGHYSLPLRDAVVIPNPGPVPSKADEWRLEDAEAGNIVFIGRFDRLKGADVAVKAFADLLRTHPWVRLTLVGEDVGWTDEQGRHWNTSSFISAHLGSARENVRVLGRVPNQELPSIRRRAIAVVHPSRYEVLGIAALEACAQGVPLVVSAVGGLAEIIRHNQTGLLSPPGDHLALADCLRQLINNPARSAEMGAAALMDYKQRFTPEVVAQQTLSFYKEVLARHARKTA